MKVGISSSAEADVADGYWFYERQSLGLGDYFRSCIFADIESLVYFGGIHESVGGFVEIPISHRGLKPHKPMPMMGVPMQCTRVAGRAFPEIKVSWRQPGDFSRSSG
jgi:hypothetical protein